MRMLIILLILAGCGGGSPDYYEQDGYCWAKTYFNGEHIIVTEDYTAYPGPCE